MMTADQIRQSFLDFFASKEHVLVPSSPVVIPTDPTLLFTNAGMNPFKDIFLGGRASQHRRVADTQKCIRVSGKHNDLEEVGRDTYHHTFFEMLGNWSFGDYYKHEAIAWAWELLTEVWNLPKERLWATVYRDDDEAARLWGELTDIDPAHILRFGEKDNFWEMGETGPCGPCSEIHFDRTPDGCGPDLVNAGSPDCIELWNLVFIQYNRKPDGALEELPRKHVDTGMGFERICSVLQHKTSNYDTDIFTPLLRRIAELSGKTYEGEAAVAMRVIADHVRTLSFAIADGVMPSNEGRGYVLRRLLRRAVRYGRNIGLREPFLGRLLPVLQDAMGGVFPEIVARGDDIARALQAEETAFLATLDRGMGLFEEVVADLERHNQTVFPGDKAFQLYDTYGFPIDLTVLMAAERHLVVDQETFNARMEAQRDRARKARKGDAAAEGQAVTRLSGKGVKTSFTGYETLEDEGAILAILAGDEDVDALPEGAEAVIVLDRTPFYAESGGQVGDTGRLAGPMGEFEVLDTRRPSEGLVFHVGRLVSGRLTKGERVAAEVDRARRERIMRHHTATHLLNAALRAHVNPSVKQAGSLVAPEHFRFDFTHYEALSPDRIEAIERFVNDALLRDVEVRTYTMPFAEVAGSGIVAVFDEKYGDVVRVVDVQGVSRELCGGTHCARTGQIGSFRITAETSIAAGVRRIEGVCGWPAYERMCRDRDLVQSLAQRFSAAPDELEQRMDQLVEQHRGLERDLQQVKARAAAEQAAGLLDRVRPVGEVALLAEYVGDQPPDVLRAMVDRIKAGLPSGVCVLAGTHDGKAHFIAMVTDDWVKKGLHAGKLVGQVAALAGGKGGGRPQLAQAGAQDAAEAPRAIAQTGALLQAMAVAN